MDFLQITLVLLVVLLGILLSVLGIQVFFILKDLKKSLDKLDGILASTEVITEEIEKPIKAAEVVNAAETVVKAGKALIAKPPKSQKRVFKIRR